ncbi:MAG: NRDE family protein [Proteobacteria bacterium]|nr:NRDE family protein [Pseudomonadota bacterium]
MCLVVLAFDVDAEYPLIVAGNRDEFHARPTQDAGWWPDAPDILGGRDLRAGGTWLAIHRSGRFATVTNTRDAEPRTTGLRSRGHLVTDFLQSELAPIDYLKNIDGSNYAGFNLFAADLRSVAFLSNRGGEARQLPKGIYGLANATLDTPWEKVERSKARLGSLLEDDKVNETELLRLLADRDKGPIDEVKSNGLPFSTAHALTAPFIVLPDFGTRCSTVICADRSGNWSFLERRFDAAGIRTGESRYSHQCS